MISLPYRHTNKPYMQVGNAYSILFKWCEKPMIIYIDGVTQHDYNVSYSYTTGGEKYYKRYYPAGGYMWNRTSNRFYGNNVVDAVIIRLSEDEYPDALKSVLNYRKRRFKF